jgi:hypothetical protein
LRTFLFVVAVIALWLAWTAGRARTQRAAIESIQSVGGSIFFDYHEKGPRTWSTSGRPRGPEWLRQLLGTEFFDRPVYVGLFGTPADRVWIEGVNQLPTIKTLLLSGSDVTDDTLARLDGSRALVELHLTSAAISDDGLRHLRKFPNLRWLILNHTLITDAGAAHLSQLGKLQELDLRNTGVSDASISLILGIADLQQVDLRGTQVTPEGIRTIRHRAPKLLVLPLPQ